MPPDSWLSFPELYVHLRQIHPAQKRTESPYYPPASPASTCEYSHAPFRETGDKIPPHSFPFSRYQKHLHAPLTSPYPPEKAYNGIPQNLPPLSFQNPDSS